MVEIVLRTQEGCYPGENTQCVGAGPSGVTVCLSVCRTVLLRRIVSKADFPRLRQEEKEPNNELSCQNLRQEESYNNVL